MRSNEFVWSDNWWIEGDKAWFIPGDGKCNVIFCMDLNTEECNFVAELPCGINKGFRLYPRCMKCGDEIYCIPNRGKNILIYHLEEKQFYEIEINNPQNERLFVSNFSQYNHFIFMVSAGLKKIIEIDCKKKQIINYYDIPQDSDKKIGLSTFVKNYIYTVSADSNQVFEFDMERKEFRTYILKEIIGSLYTICFDGIDFWLSGYRREVYKWNKEDEKIEVINDLPTNFGIYNINVRKESCLDTKICQYSVPTFIAAVVVENTVWFIPYQTNYIVYVEKESNLVKRMPIDEEDENIQNVGGLQHKYLFSYVKENRYIGLFSIKNNCFFEIDTVSKTVKDVIYRIEKEDIAKLAELYDERKIVFMENSWIHKMIFQYKLLNGKIKI